MRTSITTRVAIGVTVSCAALLAGAPFASALSGSGFIPANPGDLPFIVHGPGTVYSTDLSAEHWVYGDLGVFTPISGMTTRLTFSGYGLGESRTCRLFTTALSGGVPVQNGYQVGPVNGAFKFTFNITLTAQSHLAIACNLGKATSSQNSILYDAYVTQSP